MLQSAGSAPCNEDDDDDHHHDHDDHVQDKLNKVNSKPILIINFKEDWKHRSILAFGFNIIQVEIP